MSNKTENRKKAKTPPAWDCLAVTDVKVYPLPDWRKTDPVKAIANVTLNDQLILRGLRVIDGVDGLFVWYPNDPFCSDYDFLSVVFPITKQLREHIENCVLEKYSASLEPREWSVKFGQSGEHPNDQINMAISVKVTECTREGAIEKAKSVLRREYGEFADNVDVLCAE
jgi:stage V sporulation protein G